MVKKTIERSDYSEEKEITCCDICDFSVENESEFEVFTTRKGKQIDVCNNCLDVTNPRRTNKEIETKEANSKTFEKSDVLNLIELTGGTIAFNSIMISFLLPASLIVFTMANGSGSFALILSIIIYLLAVVLIHYASYRQVKVVKDNIEDYI